jgi:hypothetical protein
MKTRYILLSALCLLMTGAIQAIAQPPAQQMPPPVLSIFREEIKAGRNAAHETLETGYVQALRQAKWPVNGLAMTSASGTNEAWFLTGYASFAALEKDRLDTGKNSTLQNRFDQLDQQDSEFRSGQRSMMAVFRKDLSYRPERIPPSLPKARYFNVLTVRMRPGHDVEFNQAVKMYLEALEKAQIEDGTAIYQVLSGAPGGTFLAFTPVKSLAEMDAGPARTQAINAALGPENGPKLLKLIADSFLTTETTLFAFSPKMSYVSKEWAAADPDFWTPKPKLAIKPAAVPKKPVDKAPGN